MSHADRTEADAEVEAFFRDPEVATFFRDLPKDDLPYLKASIQFAKDRETAGRFAKWLAFVFGFIVAAIVAFDKVGEYAAKALK